MKYRKTFLLVESLLLVLILSSILAASSDQSGEKYDRGFTKVYFLNPSVGYIVEPRGEQISFADHQGEKTIRSPAKEEIYETDDGGNTWKRLRIIGKEELKSELKEDSPPPIIKRFTISKSKEIAFVDGDGNVYLQRVPASGLSRIELKSSELIHSANKFPGRIGRIFFLDEKHGWVANDFVLWRTEDGSKSWKRIEVPILFEPDSKKDIIPDLLEFFFVDQNVGYMPASDGRILKTTDGGQTWNEVARIKAMVGRFFFVDKDHGWISDWSGYIHSTSDGGKTWVKYKTGVELGNNIEPIGRSIIRKLFFVNEKYGWALAWPYEGDDVVLHTNDGGHTWVRQLSVPDTVLFDMDLTDPDNGLVVGNRNTILRTRNGGKKWEKVKFNLID